MYQWKTVELVTSELYHFLMRFPEIFQGEKKNIDNSINMLKHMVCYRRYGWCISERELDVFLSNRGRENESGLV